MKAQNTKLETKLVHSKHELRKMTLDNDKLRQTLKTRLGIKAQMPVTSRSNTAKNAHTEALSEMVRDGFFEQMTSMNEET